MFQRHPIQNNALMLVTTNTAGRKLVFSDSASSRQAIETLYRMKEVHPFFLFGFVVMPDHCHFLLNITAPGSISEVMRAYKIGVVYDIGLGPLWQSRFHIRFPDNGGKALEYIHLNPVRAGLVQHQSDYPWSSASGKWEVDLLPWV